MKLYDYGEDPKHLVFTLSRYKFVAKMLQGKRRVLEVGCAEGWKSRIVRQSVEHLTAVDNDPQLILKAQKEMDPRWPIDFQVLDPLVTVLERHDAVYCLDVLEHLEPERTDKFLENLRYCAPVCIIGTPSKESQAYSKRPEHINCKSGEELRDACKKFWLEVFMFGMNDEVLHTGYLPMSQYLFALCIA